MAGLQVASVQSQYQVQSLRHNQDERVVTVRWADARESRYPFIWLRHHLFFPTLGRPEQADADDCLLPELPDAAFAGEVRVESGQLEINRTHDGSQTRHDLVWLRDNCLAPQSVAARQTKPMLSTAQHAGRFESFDADVLDAPAGRLGRFDLAHWEQDAGALSSA